jgi:hypothetical protein
MHEVTHEILTCQSQSMNLSILSQVSNKSWSQSHTETSMPKINLHLLNCEFIRPSTCNIKINLNGEIILCFCSGASCLTGIEYYQEFNIYNTPTKASTGFNCQTICQNFHGCRYFSYKLSTQQCWLKFALATSIPSSDFLSGPESCIPSQGDDHY